VEDSAKKIATKCVLVDDVMVEYVVLGMRGCLGCGCGDDDGVVFI
jgi:hypothetical protein